MGFYFFNKNRQKVILIYLTLAILSTLYIINSYYTTKENCASLTKKELLSNYKLYQKIYKYYGSAKDILIENDDYVDNIELINEMAHSTPLLIEKELKEVSKYDITFKYFKNKEDANSVKNFLKVLGDEEYKIFIDGNQAQLFGIVDNKDHVLIHTEVRNLHLQDKLFNFFVGVVIFILVNIVLFIFFIIMHKSMQEDKFYMEREYKYLKEDTKKLAFEDRLTGAASRLKFDESLKDLIQLSSRFEEQKFCLLIMDIDNFKTVNDTFGHDYGDVVLKEVSKVIKRNIRESDLFARWGGEEFIVLLPLTDKDHALSFSEKVRELISEIKFEKLEKITCSFGLTCFIKGDDEKSILKRADELLYEAKKTGKNKVVYS